MPRKEKAYLENCPTLFQCFSPKPQNFLGDTRVFKDLQEKGNDKLSLETAIKFVIRI